MTDITNMHLEAAIIDQKVAGVFPDKAYAFIATVGNGYQLGVVIANEPGFNPIAGKAFVHYREAEQWAEGLNKHIGLSKNEVTDIIGSTMRGRRVVVR
jgi:hypothetical protein